MHKTTLYINTEILECICNASRNYNISKSYLIKYLLNQTSLNYKSSNISQTLIKYQKCHSSTSFKLFHIAFSDDELNTFHNSRNSLKASVSLLLLIGFVLFFKKLLKKLNKNEKIIYSYTLLEVIIPKYSKFLKDLKLKFMENT